MAHTDTRARVQAHPRAHTCTNANAGARARAHPRAHARAHARANANADARARAGARAGATHQHAPKCAVGAQMAAREGCHASTWALFALWLPTQLACARAVPCVHPLAAARGLAKAVER